MVAEIRPTVDERIDVLAAVLAHRIQRRQQFEEFHRLRRLGLLRYYDTDDLPPDQRAEAVAEQRRRQREAQGAKKAADAEKYAEVRRQAAERAAAKVK